MGGPINYSDAGSRVVVPLPGGLTVPQRFSHPTPPPVLIFRWRLLVVFSSALLGPIR